MRSRCVIGTYRFGHWVYTGVRLPVLRQVLLSLVYLGTTISLLVFNCEIAVRTRIGLGSVWRTVGWAW